MGQTRRTTDGYTPADAKTGASVGRAQLDDFESVNLFNGALNFSLPLVTFGGRGDASFTVKLPIEQKWETLTTQTGGGPVYTAVTKGNAGFGLYRYSPGTVYMENTSSTVHGTFSCNGTNTIYTTLLSRIKFVSQDGGETVLVDMQSDGSPGGNPYVVNNLCANPNPTNNRGKKFISADRSMLFIADNDVMDVDTDGTVNGYGVGGTLIFPSGVRYKSDSQGRITKITDRNGNRIDFAYTPVDTYNALITITDSISRVITIAYRWVPTAGYYDTITFKGYNGATRTIKVHFAQMNTNSALRQGESILAESALWTTYWNQSTADFKPIVVSKVELPDNNSSEQNYRFYYNSYGELARVILPTGGGVDYDWYNYGGDGTVLQQVTKRTVYKTLTPTTDPSNPPSGYVEGWTEYATVACCSGTSPREVVVKSKNAAGTLLQQSKHYFRDAQEIVCDVTGYANPQQGLETKIEEYQVSGGMLGSVVRTTEHTYDPGLTGTAYSCTGGIGFHRIKTTTITLHESNQVTKVTAVNPSTGTLGFDSFNNQTDWWEYDYGSGAPSTNPLRHRKMTYLTTNSLVSGSPNYATDTSIWLRSLPEKEEIFRVDPSTGTETKEAETKWEYDKYANDGYNATITGGSDRTGLVQHESAFDNSYKTRGNPTAVIRVLYGSTNTDLPVYSRYDIAGNVVSIKDACGKTTSFDFDDDWGGPNGNARTNSAPSELGSNKAFVQPRKVTNALGHEAWTQRDYYTGKPVDVEDANGVVDAIEYNDEFDRVTKVTSAYGISGQTRIRTITYDDAANRVTAEADQLSNNDLRLKTVSIGDGLGRPWRTASYDGTNYSIVDEERDGLGRVYRRSNPYFASNVTGSVNPSGVWMTTTFDGIGRVTTVTYPDSSTIVTQYSGSTETVTDQAGKVRRVKRDALGRLTDVAEDPNLGQSGITYLNYSTTYKYNSLDKLTQVTQGGQNRYWLYDSLGRKIALRVPEQSAPHSITDSLTGNNSWSAKFTYDANDNLLTRTDARSWVSTWAYDELNRQTGITYSGTSPAFPAVIYEYDSATTYGVGRLYSVQRNNRFGSTNAYNKETINNYDPHGRATKKTVGFLVGGNYKDYVVEQSYNLAGQVTQVKYPSGRTVDYTHSRLGLTTQVTGNLGTGGSALTYASNVTYNAKGQPVREQWGTDTALYLNRHYNNRLQLYDIRLGTSSTNEWEWNRGALRYYHASNYAWGDGGADNNGQLYRAEHFVPLDSSVNNWIISSDYYSYDRINRLTRVTENAEQYVSGTYNTWQAFKQSYQFDRWGNLAYDQANSSSAPTRNLTVDSATNRVTPDSSLSATISYDVNGNIIYDDLTGYSGANRVFDPDNKLYTSTDYVVSENRYDGAGNRSRKKVGTDETWYVYGISGELLAEYAANASTVSPTTEYGYKGGQLLIRAAGSERYWMVLDKFGTPRMLVLKTGALADIRRHDFYPFGEEIDASSGARTTTAGYYGAFNEGVNQQFTGKERDGETTLDYFGARYYSSGLGRFVSVDPLDLSGEVADPQSWNRYSYVTNRPLLFIDPTGEKKKKKKDNEENDSNESAQQQPIYVIFYAIDGGPEAPALARAAQTEAANIRAANPNVQVQVVGVSNWQQFVNEWNCIRRQAKGEGAQVEQFVFYSHGGSTGGPVLPGVNDRRGFALGSGTMGQLETMPFAERATSTIYACHTGSFGQRWANFTGTLTRANVTAYSVASMFPRAYADPPAGYKGPIYFIQMEIPLSPYALGSRITKFDIFTPGKPVPSALPAPR
jgi:RHS repeat-associated protein